jgi:hypothetical protein
MGLKYRTYTPTPEAVSRARAIGLYGNTAKRLMRAAKRSAQFSSDFGNRRFQDFVLTVDGDQITWVERLDVQSV